MFEHTREIACECAHKEMHTVSVSKYDKKKKIERSRSRLLGRKEVNTPDPEK